jgi:acetoin utilization deacetylase AcuC-like enzyme
MKVIYSTQHLEHNPTYEIYDGVKESYAEKPERLLSIVEELSKDKRFDFISPKVFPLNHIEALHDDGYIDFICQRSGGLKKNEILYPSYFMRDTYAPLVKGTYNAAVTSASIALTGAELIRSYKERVVYSLCRPPGHHAECNAMGGYCYFNNAAIAANYLSQKGRVAILDVDFHHGNGTQAMFYERSDVYYISLHADPKVKFPYISGFKDEKGKGKGLGFNQNYPLPLGISNSAYNRYLLKALRHIKKFKPTYLVVSLGFDTYEKDPICGFNLTIPYYQRMGREIVNLNLPTLLIQEGGYFVGDLGKIASSFLTGFSSFSKAE